MNHSVEEIGRLLEQEIVCYRDLLDVVEQEKEILLHGDHKQLMDTAERKVALARVLAGAQQQRRDAMATMSPDPEKPLRLSDLAGMLPDAQRAEFRKSMRMAESMARRLGDMSQANRGFLEEALDLVQQMLRILTGQNHGATYNKQSSTQQSMVRPRLLAREV